MRKMALADEVELEEWLKVRARTED